LEASIQIKTHRKHGERQIPSLHWLWFGKGKRKWECSMQKC